MLLRLPFFIIFSTPIETKCAKFNRNLKKNKQPVNASFCCPTKNCLSNRNTVLWHELQHLINAEEKKQSILCTWCAVFSKFWRPLPLGCMFAVLIHLMMHLFSQTNAENIVWMVVLQLKSQLMLNVSDVMHNDDNDILTFDWWSNILE